LKQVIQYIGLYILPLLMLLRGHLHILYSSFCGFMLMF